MGCFGYFRSMTVFLQALPNCGVLIRGRESAIPQPALAAPAWKTRARVARKQRVPFAPPVENGRVVLLPIECVPSFTHPDYPSPKLAKCGNLEKVRDRKITD